MRGTAKLFNSVIVLILSKNLVRCSLRSNAGGLSIRDVLIKLKGSLEFVAKWEQAWPKKAAKCCAEKSVLDSILADRTWSEASIKASLSFLWRAGGETLPSGSKESTRIPAKHVDGSVLVS